MSQDTINSVAKAFEVIRVMSRQRGGNLEKFVGPQVFLRPQYLELY